MPVRRAMLALSLLLVPCLAPAPASAAVDTFQITTYVPNRLWIQASWIPFAIDPLPGRVRTLRRGGRSWRGVWVPAAIGGWSIGLVLDRSRSFGDHPHALLADVRLTPAIRRRFVPVAELYRDADVLVVAAGHPACAGLSHPQARAIARGTVTRWADLIPGAAGAIRVRYPSRGADDAELRFGAVQRIGRRAKPPYPAGAKGALDGGVAAAASGDATVAAITAWSRLRRTPPGTCVVPLGGVAPSDEAVAGLLYPASFPVTYLRPRRAAPFALAQYDAMAALFRTEAFQAQLRGYGLLPSA